MKFHQEHKPIFYEIILGIWIAEYTIHMANHFRNHLKGKVAFVTGASSGIGQATAIAFARDGANVVIADIFTDGAAETARKIEEFGRKVLFVKCDVSRVDDVKLAMNRTIETFGRLDCVFNNAGIEGRKSTTIDCTEENWDNTINVNLKSIWLCMKYQIPQMIKQGGGSIVNCASVAGLVGFQELPAYVASKHGIIGLTKTAALEYAKANVRVNAVCPGVIHTPMVDRITRDNADLQKQLIEGEPAGRMGKPEEIAEAVIWLCSDAASFVTGHPMAVDGGWVAQ